jgi:hypothetical protein
VGDSEWEFAEFKIFTMPSDFFPLTLREGKDTDVAVAVHN